MATRRRTVSRRQAGALVLMGGPDAERAISLESGTAVADALRADGRYRVAEKVIDTVDADDVLRLCAGVVMDMQYLVGLPGLEDLLVWAVFPVQVAGHLIAVRYLMAFSSDNIVLRNAIRLLIGFIGGNDMVVLVDQNKRVVLGINQRLDFNRDLLAHSPSVLA